MFKTVGPLEVIVILVIILLVFGVGRIGKLGGELGKAFVLLKTDCKENLLKTKIQRKTTIAKMTPLKVRIA